MAYGREMLRKAGKAFLDFDEKYADMMFNPAKQDQFAQGTRALPLREVPGYNQVTDGAGNILASDTRSQLSDLAYGAANVGVRYGLPAAGVTIAGKGLYDLTAMFGNGADYPEQGSLPL